MTLMYLLYSHNNQERCSLTDQSLCYAGQRVTLDFGKLRGHSYRKEKKRSTAGVKEKKKDVINMDKFAVVDTNLFIFLFFVYRRAETERRQSL